MLAVIFFCFALLSFGQAHHISIDPSLLRNFSTGDYEAGHMMYIDGKSHAKLRADIAKFYEDSLRR